MNKNRMYQGYLPGFEPEKESPKPEQLRVTDMFKRKAKTYKYYGTQQANKTVIKFSDWTSEVQFFQAMPWGFQLAIIATIFMAWIAKDSFAIKTAIGIEVATLAGLFIFWKVVKEVRVNKATILSWFCMAISAIVWSLALTDSFKSIMSFEAGASIFFGGFIATFAIWASVTNRQNLTIAGLLKQLTKKDIPPEKMVIDPHEDQINKIYANYRRSKEKDSVPEGVKLVYYLIIISITGMLTKWWIAAILIFIWLAFVRIVTFPSLGSSAKSDTESGDEDNL